MVAFESDKSPLINFGTSSDRIGTPAGFQCYYFTFAKKFDSKLSPYISLNYSEFNRGINFPFGASLDLSPSFSILGMYDGQRSHLMLTHKGPEVSTSLMWVWLKHPGISVSWKF